MVKVKSNKWSLNKIELGAKLKTLRISHSFVQDDLSQYLGMTRSAYSSIESGTYTTRVEILGKIILFYSKNGSRLVMEELIGLNKYLIPVGAKVKRTRVITEEEITANELKKELIHQRKIIAMQKKILEDIFRLSTPEGTVTLNVKDQKDINHP